MGSCFSIGGDDSVSQSTAKVISSTGNLHEYSVPMNVSQVLEIESVPNVCFLCNSDQLFYDDYIKALDSNEELRMGQIYFVLPMNRLKFRLSASDMAALAVKASSALMGGGNGKKKNGRSGRNKKIRISPVHESSSKQQDEYKSNGYVVVDGMMKRFEKPAIVEMKRSWSVRKLQSKQQDEYKSNGYVVVDGMMKRFEKPAIVEMKRSGSVRKLQRNASRRGCWK